jgi:hypothetical protein
MVGRKAFGLVMGLVLAAPAMAQDHRVEVGVSAGWTFSDGVTFDGVLAGDGALYNSIDPKDAFSYGLNIGFFVNPSTELGFLFSQQKSQLEVGGSRTVTIGDMNVDNYHGYVAYHLGDPGARVRPYLLLGAGATHYGGVPFTSLGQSFETSGSSQFSGTFGLGLKIYSQGAFGMKLQARWTPTYIKSDSEGWWCDPYWGCYVVGDAQYSNQFELTGGIVLRF